MSILEQYASGRDTMSIFEQYLKQNNHLTMYILEQYLKYNNRQAKINLANQCSQRVDNIGWDSEFDSPEYPVEIQIVYHCLEKPDFMLDDFPIDRIYHNGIPFDVYKNELPKGLYIFTTSIKNIPALKNQRGFIIAFTWDCRGLKAGSEYQGFFHTCIENVKREYHLASKDVIPSDKETPTNFLTTYSNAEFCTITSDKKREKGFRQYIRDNKMHETVYDDLGDPHPADEFKARVFEIQGSRVILNYPLPTIKYRNDSWYKENVAINILDTKHQGGTSVAGIGKAVGLPKVEGFDFNKHNASYYLENNPLEFCFYGAIDAIISLCSELAIHESIIGVVRQLVKEGYLPKKIGKRKIEDIARKKLTSSGVGEEIIRAYLDKEGKLQQFNAICKWCERELSVNDSIIKGGLTQRLEGYQLLAFCREFNSLDYFSHYPTAMDALSPFPIYEPESYGSAIGNTLEGIRRSLSGCDWYTLTISFTFPENARKIDCLLLQKDDNGESLVAREVVKQKVTKPELEYLASIHPNIKVKVNNGWYWDRKVLEGDLKDNESVEDYYINLSPLMKRMKQMKSEYKKEGNKLMETAVKLVMNSIYGKFAQDKEVYDPEALDQAILNDGDINSVGLKTRSKSKISNPILANAITGLGRAVTAYCAYKLDAVHIATDSISLDYELDTVNLQSLNTSFDSTINKYLEIGKLKHETPDKTMALFSSARGRVNIPYDEKLASMIESIYDTRDVGLLENIIDYVEQNIIDENSDPPKINKDGLKYNNKGWSEWLDCFINIVKLYAGLPFEWRSKHLGKYPRIYQNENTYLNEQISSTVEKDCIDFRSYFWKNFDEFYQHKRLKDKLKRKRKEARQSGKDYQHLSYGYKLRFDSNSFYRELSKSKGKKHRSKSIPNDIKRVMVLLAHSGLIADAELARLLGITKQSFDYWRRKLIESKLEDHWGDREFHDYQTFKDELANLSNSEKQAIVHNRQINTGGDELLDKRISKHLSNLLNRLESYFGVTFAPKSKRSKKLSAVA